MYLKTDLLPRSQGDFRLGAATYAKKLLYEEMVDIPLDRLLQIGYDDLHANQKKFRETAALIDQKQDSASRSWRRPKRTIRRRTSCSTRSATPRRTARFHRRASRSSPFRRRCRRFSKRRRPSCAR